MHGSGSGDKVDEVLDSWEDAAHYGAPGLDRRIRESLTQTERARNDRKLLVEEHFSVVAASMPKEAGGGGVGGDDSGGGMPIGPIRILKRPQPRDDNDGATGGGAGVNATKINGVQYASIAERYAAYNEVRLRIFGSQDPETAADLRELQSGSGATAHSSKHGLP